MIRCTHSKVGPSICALVELTPEYFRQASVGSRTIRSSAPKAPAAYATKTPPKNREQRALKSRSVCPNCSPFLQVPINV